MRPGAIAKPDKRYANGMPRNSVMDMGAQLKQWDQRRRRRQGLPPYNFWKGATV
jgi:hypothetical protein